MVVEHPHDDEWLYDRYVSFQSGRSDLGRSETEQREALDSLFTTYQDDLSRWPQKRPCADARTRAGAPRCPPLIGVFIT